MGKIAELREQLLKKERSCTEITEEYLRAMESANPALNAYVKTTPEEALAAAGRVDQKLSAGEPLAPLEGIPMALKDNISTKGLETTCCSKILKGYTPIYDATVWAGLKARNAVLLGKVNMDEFAMGSSSEPSCFGPPKNPFDTGHVAGGSSGGAASAVAGGLAIYALGSDTGGSIRQPASFCGLTGLKPTYGAVSRYGLIAYASSFDQIGPLALCAQDAAEVFDAISGKDPMDSTSTGAAAAALPQLEQPLAGKTVGLAREYFDGVREEVKSAVLAAAEVYRSLGAEVVELSLPELKFALPVYYILACAEASSNLARYDGIRYGYRSEHYNGVNDMIARTRSEGFGPEVQRRILLGNYVLSSGYYDAYYKKAQNLRGTIVRAFDGAFARCDFLLTPTVPMTAFPLGFTAQSQVETYLTDICTVPVNICGLPALSEPCGFDRKGLPIGMQLIGSRGSEGLLLAAAHQYEKETGFAMLKTPGTEVRK